MKPYTFLKYITSKTNEICNQQQYGFYLSRAKSVLSHLSSLGWNDTDIYFLIPQIINSLKVRGIIPKYQYICGILLNTKTSPTFSSEEDNRVFGYEEWIRQEIERVSK